VKGDAYEGLLEKNAEDVKSGAGQYFTPRPLIRAIVEVMQPEPGTRIADPACGTGGFLLAAHESIAANHLLDPDQKKHLRYESLRGWEIVDNTRASLRDEPAPARDRRRGARVADRGGRCAQGRPGRAIRAGADEPAVRTESSMTFVSDEGDVGREDLVVVRDDFWASTSNKQLNFVQHVKTLLAIDGRAAVVVPDNVLFEGGARSSRRLRSRSAVTRARKRERPSAAEETFEAVEPADVAPSLVRLASTSARSPKGSRSSADLSVAAVDEQLALVPPGDLACRLSGFGLRAVGRAAPRWWATRGPRRRVARTAPRAGRSPRA
jgi:hypothetical protein